MSFLAYILALTLIYLIGLIIFGFWDFIKFLSDNKGKLLKSLKMNLWEFKFGKSFLFIPNFIMEILAFEEFALFNIFDSLINTKINIYEKEVGCGFSFYKWGEFKDYKIEDGYIRLISKFPLIIRLIFVRDVYLKYDKELENIIKKHLKQK
ncbi:hypothetical protein JH146_1205 [Methanocaldococcus bathoardescens]|uniref:Uncharacterized protein n=1 Tax=Methanocaldococcus bathoardescens TaxID=1301915 RepID=A0A076LGT0_9EURY|nr:hypothetical protein [Methanocaldococcus bathoardescens]AIJ06047.1 hypothetical protein JH146_1205 [Methanocaldococcus bathoardescens]